jgi:phospholipid-binding lipoprotein MlaA
LIREMKKTRTAALLQAAMIVSVLLLAGCAGGPRTASAPPSGEIADPLEPVNRAIFSANQAVDKVLLKPAAKTYRTVLPQFVRDRLRAILDNLYEPLIFANDVLQGRPRAAAITLSRFMLNSTAGLAGMFDIASSNKLPKQTGDFGETLYFWGFNEGFYVVMPIFGSSNLRDAVGFGVDSYGDPVGIFIRHYGTTEDGLARTLVDGLDLRARNIETLDQLKREALDFYALMRSVTQQRRRAELREASGKTSEYDELSDPGQMP